MRHEGLMWLPSCNSVAVQDINALIKPADLTAPGSVLVDALTKFVEQNEGAQTLLGWLWLRAEYVVVQIQLPVPICKSLRRTILVLS